MKNLSLYISSVSQSVSVCVCVCVCMFVPQLLQTVEPQEPSILRDDSPLDKEGFRLYKIRIRENVSKK